MFNALAKPAPEFGFHVPDEPNTVDTSRHAAIIRFRRFRWDLDTCNDSSLPSLLLFTLPWSCEA
jgi:hypothetical protein